MSSFGIPVAAQGAPARAPAPPSPAEIVSALDSLSRFLADSRTRLEVLMKESGSAADLSQVRAFIRKPWCVVPKGPSEYWLVVPAWSDISAGWLHSSTEGYRIFVVDRYSQWFGAVPQEMRAELALPEGPRASVGGGALDSSPEVARKVAAHLGAAVKPGERWKVRPGHEFALLAELISMGAMPFTARPVPATDLRNWPGLAGPCANLRDYQRDAWNEFLAHGAIGVFWPMSAGKTVLGCYAIARLVGRKLLVVPSRTLVEQWRDRIVRWVGADALAEVDLVTYAAYERIAKREYALMLGDEVHRLPANSYSKFATARAKYRIGLSASPHREDGRTEYIMAFTGKPVGVDWRKFFDSGLIRPPDVRVRVFRGEAAKLEAAVREAGAAARPGRRLVFCDSIDLGKRLAARLGCPFVYGESDRRLETIKANDVCVVSRVGDEGLSFPDLAKVVEVGFHGGSRRQEMQRAGRLFHADAKGEHVVLMTRDEFSAHSRRFLALEERGLRVRVSDETT